MKHLSAPLDYETSTRAGADGMFQVASLEDDDGNDFTSLVDQGTHYKSLKQLQDELSKKLNEEVSLTEV